MRHDRRGVWQGQPFPMSLGRKALMEPPRCAGRAGRAVRAWCVASAGRMASAILSCCHWAASTSRAFGPPLYGRDGGVGVAGLGGLLDGHFDLAWPTIESPVTNAASRLSGCTQQRRACRDSPCDDGQSNNCAPDGANSFAVGKAQPYE